MAVLRFRCHSARCFNHGGWHIALSSLEDLAALEKKWIELHSEPNARSFSHGWVSSGLEPLPPRFDLLELRLERSGRGRRPARGIKKLAAMEVVPSNAGVVTRDGTVNSIV